MATATRGRRATGPFLLPARVILAIGGVLAVALAAFNLYHEFRAAQVDAVYTAIAIAVGVIWLVSVTLAYLGWRLGIFLAALIAFVEFGLLTSSHFVSSAGALGTFVKHEGLPIATVDMALIPACMLVVFGAAVAWTNPRGRRTRLEMLPLLLAALVGAILVILQATDDLHRADFGAANPEDGAFVAAVLASIWLAGGLWISRVRRTGALLIAISTFVVVYSFVTLHLVTGTTSIQQIERASGAVWAWIAVGAAVLAAASFLLSLGILVTSFVRRRATATAAKQPVRRGA